MDGTIGYDGLYIISREVYPHIMILFWPHCGIYIMANTLGPVYHSQYSMADTLENIYCGQYLLTSIPWPWPIKVSTFCQKVWTLHSAFCHVIMAGTSWPILMARHLAEAKLLCSCCYTKISQYSRCFVCLWCTLHRSEQCTVHSWKCTVYSVECTVYRLVHSVQCILHSV